MQENSMSTVSPRSALVVSCPSFQSQVRSALRSLQRGRRGGFGYNTIVRFGLFVALRTGPRSRDGSGLGSRDGTGTTRTHSGSWSFGPMRPGVRSATCPEPSGGEETGELFEIEGPGLGVAIGQENLGEAQLPEYLEILTFAVVVHEYLIDQHPGELDRGAVSA